MKGNRRSTPIRSARFRFHRFLGWLRLSCSEVHFGGTVAAYGMPLISLFPGSQCHIGAGSTLISTSFATALGINHPVVLRTLTAGASIRIGARVGISGGSICAATQIEIGDDTLLGANITIADTDFHSLHPSHRHDSTHWSIATSEICIGRRVFIGTNAIVLKGVTIGDNSVIGAASVVTASIPGNVVAAGNPCRPIRDLTPEELNL
jgi:acetyltransferase-like isoleucine patch superfamily enzyme